MTNPFGQQQASDNPFGVNTGAADLNEQELGVITKTNNPTEKTPDSFGLVDYPAELGKGVAAYVLSAPRWLGAQSKQAGELAAGFQDKTALGTFKESLLSRILIDSKDGSAPNLFENIGSVLAAEKDALVNLLSSPFPNFPERLTNAGNALIEDNKSTLQAMGLVPKDGGNFLFSAGQGFGSMAASVGITMISKKPELAAALMGMIIESEDYLEARAAKKQPLEAAQIAFASAIPQTMVEAIGGKFLLNAAANSTRFATVVKRTLGQGLEEGVQSIIEETVKAAADLRNTPISEKVNNVLTNFAIGIIVGAPVSALATALEKNAPREMNLTPDIIDKITQNALKNRDELTDELTFLVDKEASKVAADPNATSDSIAAVQEMIAQIPEMDKAKDEGKTEDPKIAARLIIQDKNTPTNIKIELQDRLLSKEPITIQDVERILNKRERETMAAVMGPAPTLKAPLTIRVPKEPLRFVSWLQKQGGIRDDAGDIISMLGGAAKYRPGLINSKGRFLDAVGELAREAGYFNVRPTTSEILDKIAEDLSGNPQYSALDANAAGAHHEALALQAEIDQLATEHEIDLVGKTLDDFWAELDSKLTQKEVNKITEDANAAYDAAVAAEEAWRATLGDVTELPPEQTPTLEELENVWRQERIADSVLPSQGERDGQGATQPDSAAIPQGGGANKGGAESAGGARDSKRFETYEKVVALNKAGTTTVEEKVKDNIKDFGNMVSSALVPISTRLKNIAPSLKNRLRSFEFRLAGIINQDRALLEPFLKKWQALPRDVKAVLDFAMKNGDATTIEIIASQYDMVQEIEDVKTMLDGIYRRAAEVGYEIGYIENYFPRHVTKPQQLLDYFKKDWGQIATALREKEVEIGRILTIDEKAHLINTTIRGYGKSQLQLAKPGAAKKRTITEVTPEISQFYNTTDQALLRYASIMNNAIEARRFFGKRSKTGMIENIDDSVGFFVLQELLDGTITPAQQDELTAIIRSRFNRGQMSSFWRVYKNFSYIDTMGSFVSAVTQLGDLAFAMYKSGVYRTVTSLTKAAVGASEVTMQDINIHKIAQEFEEGGYSSSAVQTVFKLSGLNIMDRIGKETIINSSLQKFRAQAKSPNKQFRASLETIFEEQTESVLSDLKSGEITENVKLLLFNDILDLQPVALSEMPEAYLKAGNGRIFYMLKTFTIKQFDIYRNEVFSQIRKDPVQGIKNLLRLTFFFTLLNAGADFLKDLILNRDTPPEDHVINNIARIFGVSKFQIYTARKEGAGTAAFKTIAPPFKFIDSAYKDMAKAIESGEVDVNDLKSVQSVPIAGKFYYWWFGAGAEEDKTSRNF